MMFYRGRRLRESAVLREMVREFSLRPADLIMPYIVAETADAHFRRPIESMPGQFQLSLDMLEREVGEAVKAGLRSCLLFGIPAAKDAAGSGAYAENGVVQQAVRRLKAAFPHLYVITDVCLCEYTDHGHCGLVTSSGRVQNDPTLRLLARTALSHAQAGADMVAPSDMMDGRVAAIRAALDENGCMSTPIMSYAVKYASAFYGPFREAAESAPKFGDRRSYQMDPANAKEALREAGADVSEGADILIVKPGVPYLDIVRAVSENFSVPVAAYQVSGEYAMIKAAERLGWIDGRAVMLESLLALKRAGASLLLTYGGAEILREGWLS